MLGGRLNDSFTDPSSLAYDPTSRTSFADLTNPDRQLDGNCLAMYRMNASSADKADLIASRLAL